MLLGDLWALSSREWVRVRGKPRGGDSGDAATARGPVSCTTGENEYASSDDETTRQSAAATRPKAATGGSVAAATSTTFFWSIGFTDGRGKKRFVFLLLEKGSNRIKPR